MTKKIIDIGGLKKYYITWGYCPGAKNILSITWGRN